MLSVLGQLRMWQPKEVFTTIIYSAVTSPEQKKDTIILRMNVTDDYSKAYCIAAIKHCLADLRQLSNFG